MNELIALFEMIFLDEKKGRKVRGHDAMIEELRKSDANSAAIALIDLTRGESGILFPILAGTLSQGSLAQEWTIVTFSGGTSDAFDWSSFSSWRDYCESVSFEPENLSLSLEHEEAWEKWRETHEYVDKGCAVGIGFQAGGEGVWALPNGEVWLALMEPGEIPFLQLFPDLEDAIVQVDTALTSGELVRVCAGQWRWGEYLFEDGGDNWVRAR